VLLSKPLRIEGGAIVKCLVTGGVGFIGSHLVNYLKKNKHWVRVADIRLAKECYLPLEADEILQTDLRVRENCLKATKGIDWVFNLAANMGGIGFIMRVGAEVMRDNGLININVLDSSRQNGVKRIFFSSSACIYPAYLQEKPLIEPLKEEHAVPAMPDSFYGWEKLFSEKLYETYKRDYGMQVRIARFHNIYGSYTTYDGGREKAPAALCRKVAEASDGGTISIWGDGQQTRSFLYIDDCLEAIYKLMRSDYSEPLNIGSDALISIDDLADMIMVIANKKLRKVYDPSQPQGVRGRNADLTQIEKVLDWRPKVAYREGMEKLYRWVEKMVHQGRTKK
jgi:GDP-D-mannose 3',5'-epimerase